MGKTKIELIPLTVRLAPRTYRQLNEITRNRPHLSLNVLINEILETELAERQEFPTGRKAGMTK